MIILEMNYSWLKIILIFIIMCSCAFIFAEEVQEDIAEVFYQEGLKKNILKDYIGSINDFQNAYQLKGDDTRIVKMYVYALIKQGNIEYEQKDYETALAYFSKALLLSGRDEELQNKLKIVKQAIEEEKKLQELAAATTTTESEVIKEKPETEEKETPTTEKKETPVTTIKKGEAVVVHEKEIVSSSILPSVLKVEMPYDMEEYISRQNTENMRMLNQLIEFQENERNLLLTNIERIAESQSADRHLFSNLLFIVLGIIGGILFLIILFVFIIVVSRRRRRAFIGAYDEQPTLMDYTPEKLIEYTKNIDDTKYITDEHYSSIIKAKHLGDFYNELKAGKITWETLQKYITELNFELKAEVINLIENKLKSDESTNMESVIRLLLPLITDSEKDISNRSREIVTAITSDVHREAETEVLGIQDSK